MTYGVLLSKPTMVRTGNYSTTYALSHTDTVWMRSGSGQTIAATLTGDIVRHASANNLNLILDSNTQWTGDGGTGTVTLNITPYGSQYCSWSIVNNTAHRLSLKALVKEALKIRQVSAVNGALNIYYYCAALELRGILFEEDAAVPSAQSLNPLQVVYQYNKTVRIMGCVFSFQRAQSTGRSITPAVGTSGFYALDLEFNDCEVRQNYSGSSNPTTPVIPFASTNNGNYWIRWIGGKITGIGTYRQPIFAGAAPTSITVQIFTSENCKGADIPGSGIAPWKAWDGSLAETMTTIYQSTAESGRSFRYETAAGCADWISTASPAYPVLNGRMLDNTQYSIRALWLYGTGQDLTRGFKVPRMSQVSRGATETKTFLLESMIPTSATLTSSNLRMAIRYFDNSGNSVTEIKTGSDFVSSAASWTGASNFPNHAAKKLTFTTAAQVAQYTEVAVDITLLGDSPTGSAANLYLDPGFSLS
jgi:hypothetical protein